MTCFEGTELWFPGELGADGTSGPRGYKGRSPGVGVEEGRGKTWVGRGLRGWMRVGLGRPELRGEPLELEGAPRRWRGNKQRGPQTCARTPALQAALAQSQASGPARRHPALPAPRLPPS